MVRIPRPPLVCKTCGKLFYIRPSKIKEGKGKYCSRYCRPRPSLEDRFWNKVEKTDTCWIWSGTRNQDGYGLLTITTPPRTTISAHRLSWEIHNGSIPEALQVNHHCDNPPCVNPSHLFLGSQKDNVKDCEKKGRRAILQGANNGLAKFTDADIKNIRDIYTSGEISLQSLADKQGVHMTCIHKIVKRQTWRHV